LTDNELRCELHSQLRYDFDTSITDILRHPSCEADFFKGDLTPDFDYYDPNDYNPDMGDVEVQVTPEANDNYIRAQVSLPLGGILKRGRVTSRKQTAIGLPVKLANNNPILDTQEYVVQFVDGNDEIELNANAIAESLYSLCDPGGHKSELSDSFADHRRLDTAIKLYDQTTVNADGRAYINN